MRRGVGGRGRRGDAGVSGRGGRGRGRGFDGGGGSGGSHVHGLLDGLPHRGPAGEPEKRSPGVVARDFNSLVLRPGFFGFVVLLCIILVSAQPTTHLVVLLCISTV